MSENTKTVTTETPTPTSKETWTAPEVTVLDLSEETRSGNGIDEGDSGGGLLS